MGQGACKTRLTRRGVSMSVSVSVGVGVGVIGVRGLLNRAGGRGTSFVAVGMSKLALPVTRYGTRVHRLIAR